MPQTPNDQVEEVKAQETADEAVLRPAEVLEEKLAELPSEAEQEKHRILAIVDEMRPIYRAPDQLALLNELVTRIG